MYFSLFCDAHGRLTALLPVSWSLPVLFVQDVREDGESRPLITAPPVTQLLSDVPLRFPLLPTLVTSNLNLWIGGGGFPKQAPGTKAKYAMTFVTEFVHRIVVTTFGVSRLVLLLFMNLPAAIEYARVALLACCWCFPVVLPLLGVYKPSFTHSSYACMLTVDSDQTRTRHHPTVGCIMIITTMCMCCCVVSSLHVLCMVIYAFALDSPWAMLHRPETVSVVCTIRCSEFVH